MTTEGGATDFARLIADIVISHSLNATTPVSQLRIQFTTDDRYQAFLARSVDAEVLGVPVKIACLEDVTQGKLWAYGDPRRRLSKARRTNWT